MHEWENAADSLYPVSDCLVFNKVENFLLRQTTEITQKFFDMSITSDAVSIVKELVDEILGMEHLGRVQEMMDGRITTGKSEVMEEQDWVKEVEAEEQEKFVKKVMKPDKDEIHVKCDFCIGFCMCEELYEEMKEVIGGVERSNRKDIVMKKEETVQEYKAMGFNWKQVEPVFKGDFRYV